MKKSSPRISYVTSRDLLSWTRKTLREHGLRPRKSLSQNFVVDPYLIHEIVSHIREGSSVLEIGCGIGTLTLALVNRVNKLTCVEIDPRLCSVVRDLIEDPRFIVIEGDARVIDVVGEVVVSNVPYHITSDILVKLTRENHVREAVLVLQREVAVRLKSKPGTRSYGRLTILVNTVFDVELGNIYPPSSFYPKPEVYHQVVVLKRKRMYGREIEILEDITRLLFSERRKIIDKPFVDKLGIKLSELGEFGLKLTGRRIYTIESELWLKLSKILLDKGILSK